MPPTTVNTARLTLRPVAAPDLQDPSFLRWHTDPEGYAAMAEDPWRSDAEVQEAAAHWVQGWASGGPSYWIALDRESGAALGIGGVRRLEFGGQAYANLYYRLDPAARGRRLGSEIARAAVAHAREWHPQLQIIARVAPQNAPSLRVIRGCGMREVGTWRSPHDPADLQESVLFSSPALLRGAPEGDAEIEEILDLWCAVNAAGGAVGFDGDVPRASVTEALDEHLAQLDAGESELVRIFDPLHGTWDDPHDHGGLLGFGFVHRYSAPAAHRANLERVMVDPDQHGRGLGRVLMADLHAIARSAGAEIATINYRGGTGLGSFYGRCGYVEVGRLPGGLHFPQRTVDRYVDDVQMAYRLGRVSSRAASV